MTTYFMGEPLEEEDIEEIKDCINSLKKSIRSCCGSIISIFY